MKKMLLLTGVASVFAFSANAFDFNPYLAARFKYASSNNSVAVRSEKFSMDKDLLGGSGALGVSIPAAGNAIRLEAEYTRSADAKRTVGAKNVSAELRTQALMFNAYYDFNTSSPFAPYVSAGVGGSRLKLSAQNEAIHQTKIAWQVGLGVSYKINEHFAADLGYRFIDYGQFSDYIGKQERSRVKVESKANEFMLGVRYTF